MNKLLFASALFFFTCCCGLLGGCTTDSRKVFWEETDEMITFSLEVGGTISAQACDRLVGMEVTITEGAGKLLANLPSPTPPPGPIHTVEVAIFKGEKLMGSSHNYPAITALAAAKGYQLPPPEVACVAMEKIQNKQFKNLFYTGPQLIFVMSEAVEGYILAMTNGPTAKVYIAEAEALPLPYYKATGRAPRSSSRGYLFIRTAPDAGAPAPH